MTSRDRRLGHRSWTFRVLDQAKKPAGRAHRAGGSRNCGQFRDGRCVGLLATASRRRARTRQKAGGSDLVEGTESLGLIRSNFCTCGRVRRGRRRIVGVGSYNKLGRKMRITVYLVGQALHS